MEYVTTLRHERNEGIDEATVKNALNVMVKFNVTAEQALDALDVLKPDQPKYLQMMKEKV